MYSTRSWPRCSRFIGLALIFVAMTIVLAVSVKTAWAQGEFSPRGPYYSFGCQGPGVEIHPGMSVHRVTTAISGEISCSDLTGSYCPGFVSSEPFCLRVIHPTQVDIEVTWSDIDTVLALTGPAGVFTDDDGGRGTQSQLSVFLTPGDYTLFPGSFSWHDRGQAAIEVRESVSTIRERSGYLTANEATGPHPSSRSRHRSHDGRDTSRASGDPGDLHGHDPRPPSRGSHPSAVYRAICPVGAQVVELSAFRPAANVSGMAVGQVDSSDRVGFFAPGWLPESPQVCLVLSDPGRYRFEVTHSQADTVLALVPTPHAMGAQIDDDGGRDTLSMVEGYFSQGVYLLYVGTYSYSQLAPFQLAASRLW